MIRQFPFGVKIGALFPLASFNLDRHLIPVIPFSQRLLSHPLESSIPHLKRKVMRGLMDDVNQWFLLYVATFPFLVSLFSLTTDRQCSLTCVRHRKIRHASGPR